MTNIAHDMWEFGKDGAKIGAVLEGTIGAIGGTLAGPVGTLAGGALGAAVGAIDGFVIGAGAGMIYGMFDSGDEVGAPAPTPRGPMARSGGRDGPG